MGQEQVRPFAFTEEGSVIVARHKRPRTRKARKVRAFAKRALNPRALMSLLIQAGCHLLFQHYSD